MKIAQVASLWERVPPLNYGGIELVVSRLTDELVRRGREVTLFASGDSQTLARLAAIYPQALGLDSKFIAQPTQPPYLAFLGRFSREKGQTKRSQLRNKLAGA